MFIRPTPLALALMSASLTVQHLPVARTVLTHAIRDNPKNPMATGYNRTEIDGVRLSDATARKLHASIRV